MLAWSWWHMLMIPEFEMSVQKDLEFKVKSAWGVQGKHDLLNSNTLSAMKINQSTIRTLFSWASWWLMLSTPWDLVRMTLETNLQHITEESFNWANWDRKTHLKRVGHRAIHGPRLNKKEKWGEHQHSSFSASRLQAQETSWLMPTAIASPPWRTYSESWARISPSFLKLLFQAFCHGNEKSNLTRSHTFTIVAPLLKQ